MKINQDKKQGIDELLKKQETDELKLDGVDFSGIMCSATDQDMWGLTSVKVLIEMGGSTNFKFDNGSVLLLTPENYVSFMSVWMPFRQTFFQ